MYSYRIKKKAIEMVLKGYPKRYIIRKYAIKSKSTLDNWVNIYNTSGFTGLKSKGFAKTKYSDQTRKKALQLARKGKRYLKFKRN